MAKIAEFLKQILSARYGRDVRQSIHDAISAINDESTECWATVEKVPETLAIAAVKDTVSGKDITLEMSSDFVLTDFDAWGNTEQDGTPTTDAPIEPKSVVINKIWSCRKNMLPNNATTSTINGVTFTVNSDKSVTGNGTATNHTDFYLYGTNHDNGKYLFIPKGSKAITTDSITFFAREKTLGVLVNKTLINNALSKQDCYFYGVCLRVQANGTLNNATEYPMFVNANETDLTYEPYTESVVTLSEPITLYKGDDLRDGAKVQGAYVKVFTGKESLAGWTTTAGGGILFGYVDSHIANNQGTGLTGSFCNYLTETTSGQNWNSADLRFSIHQSGTPLRFRLPEGITTIAEAQAWMAEKYAEGNPLTFIIPRKDIIETPLPDADVEALKNIRTFKGITHVFTDSEVKPDMEVEYVIDTKMYIDKKIAELA